MKKLLNVQEKVKDILLKHPRTRSNDMLLYLKLAEQIDEEYQQNVMKLPFATVISNMEEYHLPTFGSVGRARRKLQEKYPKLRATDQVGVLSIIDEQPKVGEWIPVTERLPEKEGYYIITYFYEIAGKYIAAMGRYSSRTKQFIGISDVTAWMPLPEPYEEETE